MSQSVPQLFAVARAELASGKLTSARLDELEAAVTKPAQRQRLLYLHASTVSLYAPVLNASLFEPDKGVRTQIDPTAADLPYENVHDAIVDGWRVIHFPDIRGHFEDREIDILGYEFILEKLTP